MLFVIDGFTACENCPTSAREKWSTRWASE
jgi:hypothetical protein